MELLLRTNFDIPKPPAAVFDPLRYLSLGQEQREEVRITSATAVYEVARPILQGCHAIPTKLKILLDRALSALAQEEVLMIVSGCGWQLDDYQRGYKLKDSAGSPLDRWNMLTKQEEPLILQQFLLFRETRTITQQLVIQDLAERSFNPALEKREEKKEEREEKHMEQRRDSLLQVAPQKQKEERWSPAPRDPSPHSPIKLCSPPPTVKLPPSPSHPAAPIFPRSMAGGGIPLPPSSMSMSSLMSNHFGGMFPFPLPQGPKDMTPTSSALNLTSINNLTGRLTDKQAREDREREEMDSDSGSRRSSIDTPDRKCQLPEDIGISFVSPTTGKKRVQCNVCLKTFCDKGALKIHFSAVHLREMHKCSVPGCNMMFSSRRSRNRHSANPNPKLHTPHIRRKISPHDGRTHQGPVLPFSGMPPKPPISSHGHMPHHLPPHGHLPPGMPGHTPPFHHFQNLPPHLLPPDLQKLHHQQLELQRFQEMQKLSSLYSRHLAESGRRDEERHSRERDHHSNFGSEVKSESETDDQKADVTDDDKSTDNQSTKDEHSAGRKRKSQNPIRITHSDNKEEEGGGYSSDDNDEGFLDPMVDDDEEEDDTLMDYDSTDELEDGSRAKERKMAPLKETGEEVTKTSECKGETSEGKQADEEGRTEGGKENKVSAGAPDEKFEGATGKIQVRNDLTDHEKFPANNNNNSPGDGSREEEGDDMEEDDREEDDEADYQGLLDAEIPMDKDNPRRCVDCGKEFQNHFTVKIHYQNVHLKLMHKCTVDGCNAAFPSKRSRDRHSSNLTLHRKLLSTSSDGSEAGCEAGGAGSTAEGSHSPPPPHPAAPVQNREQGALPPPTYPNEFLARFLAEQQQRLAFPFLPGLSPTTPPSHLPNINGSSGQHKPAQHGMAPPPFGMMPFNPMMADMARLPGMFHKPGLAHHPGAANKSVEENLRKYMAMAGIVNKIENH